MLSSVYGKKIMAKKIKDNFNGAFVKMLAKKIKDAKPDFDDVLFTNFVVKNIRGKELIERQDVFVDAFEIYLGKVYSDNINIFKKLIGDELEDDSGMYTTGWHLWPIARYVERHCLSDVKLSFDFIEEITKRFTGEFAIRPLLKNKTHETVMRALKWSKSSNVHIRRLASEGLRIRLPWAKKLYAAVTEEFETYKIILGNLRNDKSKFIQKSVGNNLNDLFKEFPLKAEEIINDWMQDDLSKECQWVIKHGKRSINKIVQKEVV
jgi:3-methyladenine DNA glycosylase AlkC